MTIAFGTSLSKTHLDAAGDDPAQARAELEAIIDRLNTKLANVTLMQASDFPNVSAPVTASAAELNKLDGYTGTTADMNAVLTPYAAATVELGGNFDAGQQVKCERIGNVVTITAIGQLTHSSSGAPTSDAGVIPPAFRPSVIDTAAGSMYGRVNDLRSIFVIDDGTIRFDYSSAETDTGILSLGSNYVPSVTFVVT